MMTSEKFIKQYKPISLYHPDETLKYSLHKEQNNAPITRYIQILTLQWLHSPKRNWVPNLKNKKGGFFKLKQTHNITSKPLSIHLSTITEPTQAFIILKLEKFSITKLINSQLTKAS